GHHGLWRHAVDYAGRRRVPGDGCGDDADPATDVRDVGAAAVGLAEEADREHDLGDFQGEEHAEDRHVHAQAPEHHVRVEDGEGEQVPGQAVLQVVALQPAA